MNLLVTIYFLLMAGIFPLFFEHGYNRMASDKFWFFRNAGFFLAALAAAGLVRGVCGAVRKRPSFSGLDERISMTDLFVFFYGFVVCLSYAGSAFKEEGGYGCALWGSAGWYMGFFTQIVLVLIYFVLSRFFGRPGLAVGVLAGVSSAVFLLGIVNRFGWYPISMEGADRGFISTLGNINWYCGYFSVVFPLGFALYLRAEGRQRVLGALYLLVGFAAGVTQGSDSGFLVLGVLFLAGFWICCRGWERMQRLLETVILFSMSCCIIRALRMFFPRRFNYDTELIILLTYRNLAVWILVGALALYPVVRVCKRRGDGSDRGWRVLRYLAAAAAGGAVLGYAALVFINTKHPLWIPALNGNPLFTFNGDYWNGRGASWRAGIGMYLGFPLWNRLVGIGPDCFAAYAYTRYGGVWEIEEQFAGLVLTNAHNEWLTVLVNTGLWGLIAYAGIFVTGVYRNLRRAGENSLCLAFSLSLLCYTAHNMVSFQQIISAPTVFLVLGAAEGVLRREEGGRREPGEE